MNTDDDHDDQEDMGGMQVGGVSTYESTPPAPPQPSSLPPQPEGTVASVGNSLRGGGGEVIGALGRKGGGCVKYKECLKNHAVSIGGHAVDGCGEFIAAGEEGTLEALKCAACSCHRNFHRKEQEGVVGGMTLMGLGGEGGSSVGGDVHQFSPYYSTAPGGTAYWHQYPHHVAVNRPPPPPPPLPLALPSMSWGGGSRDEGEEMSNPMLVGGGNAGMLGSGSASGSAGGSRKRFRTKFTEEQRERMLGFAERVGWRIQKHDEAAVQQFCAEIGIRRHVLKVWMHNNKHTHLGRNPKFSVMDGSNRQPTG